VARKISATLASTGTPSHFLHPAEALHGDLGALRADDVVLALSQSGETEEITRLLPHLTARRVGIVALTGRADSALGRAADVVVATGALREACALGLAPSTSTSLMLALGDAIALVTSSLRQFTAEDFANGGSDRIVDGIVAWGDDALIRDRIAAHHAAGASHVCIQAFRTDGEMGADMALLERFAPARA
jgi:KpsF/GutQ family protein